MDPRNLFHIFTNSTLLATRLLSNLPGSDVKFEHSRYCSVIFEDEAPSTLVTKIKAAHKDGLRVEYSVVGGNQDGLFTIDKSSGEIYLAGSLNREIRSRHELIVSAGADSHPAQSLVQVIVADVNDNPPKFINNRPEFALVEEDERGLPKIIGRVEAEDKDWIDQEGLLYTLSGDGIDDLDPLDAYFGVDSKNGDIIQLRPLDRDAPKGKPIWNLLLKVRDGQVKWSSIKKLKREWNHRSPSSRKRKRDLNLLRHMNQFVYFFDKNLKLASKFLIPKNVFYKIPYSYAKYYRTTYRKLYMKRDTIKNRHFVKRNSNIDFRSNFSINFSDFNKFDGKVKEGNVNNNSSLKTCEICGKPLQSFSNNNSRVKFNNNDNNLKHYKRNQIYKWLMKSSKNSKVDFFKKFNIKGKAFRHFRISDIDTVKENRLKTIRKIRLSRETNFSNHSKLFSDFSLNSNLDEGNCIKFDPRNPQLDTDFEAQLNHLTSEAILTRATGQVHESEVRVKIIVKDVNDNAPVFINSTIYGEVQENGPIDLSVVKVKAYDADDIGSGTNALLTYSIEKNVVDEETGDPLFTINPENGALKTAVCCLDRETTPEYNLQVVASDGGGLKGTGTVIVRLSDLNDNSPRLSRRQWDISVDESDESLPFEHETILEMTADDPDTSNYFLFRIVPGSGNGWQKFGLRTKGNVGAVYASSKLDYEDEKQRRGLRFLVEVTDRGPGGWDDRRHVDSAWVSVTLRDINDNPPSFGKNFANVSVSEDAPTGLVLEKFKATDPDEGENGQITYRLSDTSGSLEIDAEGVVRIKRPLDREGPAGTNGTITIIASDKGDPPKTSYAILYIDIKDINDTPPRLLPPTVLHVQENLPPKMIGTLIATDDDVWSLGHGPPFKMRISDLSSDFVVKRISLTFRPDFDDGNGGAEIWTKVPLDREECPEMTLKVALSDAGGVTTVVDVVIIVDDVNDNPMKPGSKTVFLWKTMGTSSEAPLGRIYVDDLDDWDGADKTYQWADAPHPLFALDQKTGDVFAAGQVREGRYDLFFNVSDSLWGQKNISARVTVIVRLLSSEALSHAVPITLSPVTAANLTYNWIPTKGGGRLGLLTSLVKEILHESISDVKIVSVYDSTENAPSTTENHTSKLQNLHTVLSHDLRYSFGTSNRFLSSPKSITRKRGYQSYNTNLPYNNDDQTSYYNEEEYFSKVLLTPSSCVWMSLTFIKKARII